MNQDILASPIVTYVPLVLLGQEALTCTLNVSFSAKRLNYRCNLSTHLDRYENGQDRKIDRWVCLKKSKELAKPYLLVHKLIDGGKALRPWLTDSLPLQQIYIAQIAAQKFVVVCSAFCGLRGG